MKVSANRSSQGFTLIELLVVIAIIAILAAILFPVFATAREKARQSSCSSNLKQLGLAITQYEQDYDDYPPDGTSKTYSVTGWAGQIYPYVKSKAVYVCPDDQTPGASCSYAYNRNIINTISNAPWTYGYNSYGAVCLSKYNSVANTVMLGEVNGSGGYDVSDMNASDPQSDFYGAPGQAAGYSPDGYGGANNSAACSTGAYDPFSDNDGGYSQDKICGAQGCCAATFTLKYATGYPSNSAYALVFLNATGVHSGGANYLLADGHVKWLIGSKVTAGYNNSSAGNCGSTSTAANTGCSSAGSTVTWSIY